MEVWRTIEGFENYKVSNLGNVKNKTTNRVLKKELAKGYFRVSLSKDGKVTRFQVHRLVATSFYINFNDKKCVNHINGIKTDNRSINLEWVSYSENEKHSYDVLGKINPIRKLTTEQANYIKSIGIKGKGGNIKELANNYSVDVSTIYNILKNKYYAQT